MKLDLFGEDELVTDITQDDLDRDDWMLSTAAPDDF